MKEKKLIFNVLLLLLVVVLCGASKKPEEIPYIVDFNKRFVPVEKNLYADKYEATTKDFQLFLKEKREAGVDCSLLIYDSTLWRGRHIYNEPYVNYYFSHSAFRHFPIVCVSHYAVNEFCKWLTEKYENSPQKKYKKVVFRLPTETEYRKAAYSVYDSTKIVYPWGHNGLYSKNQQLCNFLELQQEKLNFNDSTYKIEYRGYVLFESSPAPALVYEYTPNPYGLYNIVGNVSEMIQEEGIAMGGDWFSAGYDVRIYSKKRYENKGTPYVGFRVYMEIIEF
jgi:formylglycine-generating enzyme required for sulfatase activity